MSVHEHWIDSTRPYEHAVLPDAAPVSLWWVLGGGRAVEVIDLARAAPGNLGGFPHFWGRKSEEPIGARTREAHLPDPRAYGKGVSSTLPDVLGRRLRVVRSGQDETKAQ